jgi:replication factor C subunit 3/5
MVVKPTDPNQNLPWVEKYRPNSLDELVSQKEIVNTSRLNLLICYILTRYSSVNKLINENRLPHLLANFLFLLLIYYADLVLWPSRNR